MISIATQFYVPPPSIPDLWLLQIVLAMFVTSFGVCIGLAILRLTDPFLMRLFLSVAALLYTCPGAVLMTFSTNPEAFADATHLVWWGSIFGSLALGPLSWWIAVDVRRSILEIPKQARALHFLWWCTGVLWFLSVVGLLSGVL
ncbi:MAG: hypothetical protein EDM74_06920 [Armatimonadetes bacterium]|nr:MAG: hypothetical protein EDM74_06920 [Armatimonadota bacterium]